MSAYLIRGQMLLEQGRDELAIEQLQLALADDPNSPRPYMFLAQAFSNLKQFDRATQAAEQAIQLAPDDDYCHFTMAKVLLDRHHWPEADAAIDRALEIDPYSPSYYAVKAVALFRQERLKPALAATEEGLRIDPEYAVCLNLRAQILTQLGRNEEAAAALDAAMQDDPEDAWTHTNVGWNLLHTRRPREALTHFGEALRLDPDFDYARLGYVEATKALNPIYGLMLRYFLWMARQSKKMQWGVVIGAVVLIEMLGRVGQQYEHVAPWVPVVLALYFTFVIMTWLAVPLFNLVIWATPMGGHILSRDQRRQCGLIALIVVFAGAFYWTSVALSDGIWRDIVHELGDRTVIFAMLAGAIYSLPTGKPRRTLALFVGGLALVSVVVWVSLLPLVLFGIDFGQEFLLGVWFQYFMWVVLAGMILSNVLITRDVRY